jgi:hypothetical protein
VPNPDDPDFFYAIEEIGVGPIQEPSSTQHERAQSNLFSTHSSDHSLTHDQDSVFTRDDLLGTIITGVSSILQLVSLQHTGSY